MTQKNASRHCFIPGCNTGYNANTRNQSLFGGPKDPELLKQWIKKIPRKDKKFSSYDAICGLHFFPGDIMKHHIHEGANGQTIILGERKRPSLKPGAIPTIFPSCAKSVTKVGKKTRKVPLNREKNPWIETASITNCAAPEKMTFAELKIHAKSVALPSSLWALQCDPEGHFVMFSRIAPMSNRVTLEVTVGVLFEGSCAPTIFLRGNLVSPLGLSRERSSLKDVSSLLSGLEENRLCIGTGYPQELYSRKCHVFILDATRCHLCSARRIRIMSDAFSKRKLNNLMIVTSRKQMILENKYLKRQLVLMKKTVNQLAMECIKKDQHEAATAEQLAIKAMDEIGNKMAEVDPLATEGVDETENKVLAVEALAVEGVDEVLAVEALAVEGTEETENEAGAVECMEDEAQNQVAAVVPAFESEEVVECL